MAESSVAVSVRNVSKHFGSGQSAVRAVDSVSVDIVDGEFFCLLGPSGSGKTTLLRLIAGFEIPNSGVIDLFGEDVTNTPPFKRDVNTVFQDYALFPHMSVRKNVEYGLRVKGVDKNERRKRAGEALEIVQLGEYGDRKPQQLSGGQRQRVALARALVNQPKVLLLDEPLGALDLKLRQQMQTELKSIQKSVGITFVFVTHDQEEALTMSDRIAVFNNGNIEQVGAPIDVYERPTTPFVASFVGTSNIIRGDAAQQLIGQSGSIMVRPEKLRVYLSAELAPTGAVRIPGRVAHVEYLGPMIRYVVDTDAGLLTVIEQNTQDTPDHAFSLVGSNIVMATHEANIVQVSA